jgi:hypothetical protein
VNGRKKLYNIYRDYYFSSAKTDLKFKIVVKFHLIAILNIKIKQHFWINILNTNQIKKSNIFCDITPCRNKFHDPQCSKSIYKLSWGPNRLLLIITFRILCGNWIPAEIEAILTGISWPSQSLQKNVEILPHIGHDHFVPHPSLALIIPSSDAI